MPSSLLIRVRTGVTQVSGSDCHVPLLPDSLPFIIALDTIYPSFGLYFTLD